MKKLKQLISEQEGEAAKYRKLAERFTARELRNVPGLVGVLLTGSTARGDARLAPLGFAIDLVIVLAEANNLDLTEQFGPDLHPEIPYHVIEREGTLLKLEPRTLAELRNIRSSREDFIFAKWESSILHDPEGELKNWKESAFILTEQDIRRRALIQRFRFNYLVNDYRQEKWEYRGATNQIAQNYNEATECFCAFLHCINGSFIPRKDWLAYLTYEYPIKPENHEDLLDRLYGTKESADLESRWSALLEAREWMEAYCKRMNWA